MTHRQTYVYGPSTLSCGETKFYLCELKQKEIETPHVLKKSQDSQGNAGILEKGGNSEHPYILFKSSPDWSSY